MFVVARLSRGLTRTVNALGVRASFGLRITEAGKRAPCLVNASSSRAASTTTMLRSALGTRSVLLGLPRSSEGLTTSGGMPALGGSGAYLLQLAGARRNMSRRTRHKSGAPPRRTVSKLRRNPAKPPKLKSHKGALKRFFQTADGTFYHKAAGKRHLQTGTSRRRQTLRKLKFKAITTKGITKKLNKLMPYGTVRKPPPAYKQPLMWERTDDWQATVAAATKAAFVKAGLKVPRRVAERSA